MEDKDVFTNHRLDARPRNRGSTHVIRLGRLERGRHRQRCTRNPKERDLDHIPLLSKSIEWVWTEFPRSPASPPSVKSPGLLLPRSGLFILT